MFGATVLSTPAHAKKDKIKLSKIEEIQLECVEAGTDSEEEVEFKILLRHDHEQNKTAVATVNEIPLTTSNGSAAQAVDAKVIELKVVDGLEIRDLGAGFLSKIVATDSRSNNKAELKLDLILPDLMANLSAHLQMDDDETQASLISWHDGSVLSTFECEVDIED